jgi:hypothetical protein
MHGQGSNRSKTKIEARKRGNIWIGGFDIQISRFARFPADLEHEFGLGSRGENVWCHRRDLER